MMKLAFEKINGKSSSKDVSDTGDKKEESKTIKDNVSVNSPTKQKMEVIKDFAVKASELKKTELYGGGERGKRSKWAVNPDTVDKMADLADKIDTKLLSTKSKDKLEDVLDDISIVSADKWTKGNRLIENDDFNIDLKNAETIGEKLRVINKQLKLEESEDYDAQEHGELSSFEDALENAKKFIEDVAKEYIQKNATEALNYKLF